MPECDVSWVSSIDIGEEVKTGMSRGRFLGFRREVGARRPECFGGKAKRAVQFVRGGLLKRRYEQPLPFNRSRLVQWRASAQEMATLVRPVGSRKRRQHQIWRDE